LATPQSGCLNSHIFMGIQRAGTRSPESVAAAGRLAQSSTVRASRTAISVTATPPAMSTR